VVDDVIPASIDNAGAQIAVDKFYNDDQYCIVIKNGYNTYFHFNAPFLLTSCLLYFADEDDNDSHTQKTPRIYVQDRRCEKTEFQNGVCTHTVPLDKQKYSKKVEIFNISGYSVKLRAVKFCGRTLKYDNNSDGGNNKFGAIAGGGAGSGGGCIKLKANRIEFNRSNRLLANGEDARLGASGAGSGGTIVIDAKQIQIQNWKNKKKDKNKNEDENKENENNIEESESAMFRCVGRGWQRWAHFS
jgi:hypothetical protein